jgi:hypothetical protein
MPNSYSGTTVFPEADNLPTGINVYYNRDDIERENRRNPQLSRFLDPVIVACVVYHDAFAVTHHTPYILRLYVVKNGFPCCVLPADADELSKSQIVLQQEDLGGLAPD